MRDVTPPPWPSTTHHPLHSHHSPPLTPTFIDPRSAPKPPSRQLSFRAFRTVFGRNRSNRPSSTYSTDDSKSQTSHPSNLSESLSPRPTMHTAPLPVVSSHDSIDDEAECPVCLEPLSFSFRLPGEKPHIVPECGHALHEVSPVHHPRHLPNDSSSVAFLPRHALQQYMGPLLVKPSLPYPKKQI
jgi:hypothetical protein